MVDASDWSSVGVFTWDRDTNTVLGMYDTKGERPDHVSMSPSGNYCVVSGDGARGTVAFSRDFSQKTQLLAKSEHSDRRWTPTATTSTWPSTTNPTRVTCSW
ncbi:hypothetical protein ACN28S_03360 [Cystobacter fuscus]